MDDQLPKIYLYRRLLQAKLFIDKNFHETIDLNDIADEAYFSKYHFIRLFKNIYGKTPHQYLIKVRIENARLLLKKNIPVADVCYAVGFESVTSFSALFKRSPPVLLQTISRPNLKNKLRCCNPPSNLSPAALPAKRNGCKTAIFNKPRSALIPTFGSSKQNKNDNQIKPCKRICT